MHPSATFAMSNVDVAGLGRRLDGPRRAEAAVGVNDLRILNNSVYNWYSALNIGGLNGYSGPTALTNLVQSGNNFTQSSRTLASAVPSRRADSDSIVMRRGGAAR